MTTVTASNPVAQENTERDQLLDYGRQHNLYGESPIFLNFLRELKRFAEFSQTVFIQGETGTGKELAARALNGQRKGKFIPINCGCLRPETERSELAGYARGSFTGGNKEGHRGLFKEAADGSLFLDEVQDLSHAGQTELLRALQNKKVLPLGASEESDVSSTRVVAASNQNLEALVKDRLFRKDLYYRLNILVVSAPPLRQRPTDIPFLAQHFVQKNKMEFGSPAEFISDECLQIMQRYSWPGNVRELENIIMAILARKSHGKIIEIGDLPATLLFQGEEARVQQEPPNERSTGVENKEAFSIYCHFTKLPTIHEFHAQTEARFIRHALALEGGSQNAVARRLDMSRQTLRRKIKEYGIAVKMIVKK